MKNPSNKLTKKYIRKVLRHIPFSFRRQVKEEFTFSLNQFLSQTSEPSELAILEHFGSPEVYAATYYSNLDPQVYPAVFKSVRHANRCMLIVMISIVLSVFVFCTAMVIHAHKHKVVYYKETVIDYDIRIPIPDTEQPLP